MKKTLKIESSATDKVKKYWIAVDDDDVASHTSPKGSIKLEEGAHYVIYHGKGTPGGTITIAGTIGDKKPFNITSKIQSDGRVANARKFTV